MNQILMITLRNRESRNNVATRTYILLKCEAKEQAYWNKGILLLTKE